MRSFKYKVLIILLGALSINLYANAALDINTASQTELESIKGFGPVKAKAIIDYRKAHGRFKSIEELDNVSGIGSGTIEKVRKALSIAPSDQSNNTLARTHPQHLRKTISTTNGVIDEFSAK